MGLNNYSAEDVINKLDEKELDKIFKFFGEEKESKFIARNIIKERSKKKIDTQTLVEIIEKTKRKKNFKVHSATKVFQALRIFVNKEITELINGAIKATKKLKPGGKILVISFHSLEDRIVKRFMRDQSKPKDQPLELPVAQDYRDIKLKLVGKKIRPSEDEVSKNQRSRSALLRVAELC